VSLLKYPKCENEDPRVPCFIFLEMKRVSGWDEVYPGAWWGLESNLASNFQKNIGEKFPPNS
jgi:hypothetical protein